MYQLTQFDTILRLADGASIPADEGNSDYRAYLAWLDEGNTPDPYTPPPPPKVTSVTMRQARLALLQTGHLDAINTAIAAAGPAAKIEWEFATQVDRSWPLVAALQPALEMSDQDIDDLFTLASTL